MTNAAFSRPLVRIVLPHGGSVRLASSQGHGPGSLGMDLTEEAERLAHVGLSHDHRAIAEATMMDVVFSPGTRCFVGPLELTTEQGTQLVASGLVEILSNVQSSNSRTAP